MRLFLIAPVLALYLYVRLFRSLPSFSARLVALFFLLIAALFPAYAQFFGGGLASLRIPFAAMCVGEFFTISLLNAFCLFLVRDILLLPLCFWARSFSLRLCSPRTTALLLTLVAGLTLYGELHSLATPVVKESVLEVNRLPEALHGMRIVHLTDLHVANVFGTDRIEEIVKRSNALHADLVVLSGDLVDGTPERRGAALAALASLKAPLGVWACDGNHEHYGPYEAWKMEFSRLGIRFLRNENMVLRHKGVAFALLGLSDPAARRFAREGPDVKRACVGTEGLFRIALVHQPRLARRLSEAGVDLMLSGHTHGGQTWLWSFIVSAANDGFVRGWYSVHGPKHPMALYVHSGTGLWSGFLQRIGTDNEIALITLKRKGS